MDPVVLYPDVKYKRKLYVVGALAIFLILTWWTVPLGIAAGYDTNSDGGAVAGFVVSVVANLVVLLVVYWAIPFYYRSLRYEIHDDEVIVYAGIITKSVKHVPYRTVTNLKVKRDPFDRLLRIGQLDIQTAGMSGSSGGAEESLAGLTDVGQVYERVAKELRRFRSGMAPTQADVEPAPNGNDSALLAAILEELRAIRAGLDDA